MFKKTFLLILIISVSALGVMGMAPGSWKVLPMSGTTFDKVVDTPDFVYYLSGGSLYSYDKENNETVYYTPGAKISDSNISSIKYNDKGKYLLCVYKNNNIDLIYDDGKVVNLPEIKEANLTVDKTINSVSFGDGRFYVATAFGIVVYDDKNHVVVESGIYNRNVQQVQEFGDNLLLFTDFYLHSSPKSERHNSFEKFKKLWNVSIVDWQKIDDDTYVAVSQFDDIYMADFDIAADKIDLRQVAPAKGSKTIEVSKDGYFSVYSDGIVIMDKEGNLAQNLKLPSELHGYETGFWNSTKSVWAADGDGIGNYDIADGNLTVLSDKYRPQSSKQFNTAFAYNTSDGSEVYFNGIGNSTYHPSGDIDWGLQTPLLLESYNWQTGEITPRYPEVEKQFSSDSQNEQNKFGLKLLYGGPGQTVIDPSDPSVVYHANNFDGLIVIKDGEVFYHYDKNNSPVATRWGSRSYGLTFDNQGNLWIAHWSNGLHDGTSPLKVLSKESLAVLRQTPEALTEKDASGNYKHWQIPKWIEGNSGWTDGKIVFAGNYGVYTDAEWNAPIVGIDTKGTAKVDDDKVVKFTAVVDQDGNVNNLYTKTSLLKDKNNNIWIGTTAGVYIIKDVRKLVDDSSTNLSVTRPKVARNDGTNYADYLLDSDEVICMAVDPTNRKWIGTSNSGLFLVNESGTEILAEFNKDNSPLVSNTITMVACDPHGNDVLIGTKEGLFVYSSDASPAEEDYSNVYAYPNPVRPEYTGWITIKGLMDDSLVKIADVQGHVVWNGRSEGGLAVWDGCDASGNRVRSGVYMVYTSQNASGSSSGAVTKIVVIN